MVVRSKCRTTPSAASVDNVGGRRRFVSCFISDSAALSAVQGSCGPEHPDSGVDGKTLTSQRPAKLVQQSEENVLPRIPRQQPTNHPSARRDDLRRHLNHRAPERRKIHPQQSLLLFPAILPPTTVLRQHQSRPRLQTPRQRTHHHISPVARQTVHRRRKRLHAALGCWIRFS